MNTLGRAATPKFHTCKDGFSKLNEIAKKNSKSNLTVEQVIILNAARGKNWMRGFTPPTNAVKIANGGRYNWGVIHGLRAIHMFAGVTDTSHYRIKEKLAETLSVFEGVVGLQELKELSKLLPRDSDCYAGIPESFKGEKPETINLSKEDKISA